MIHTLSRNASLPAAAGATKHGDPAAGPSQRMQIPDALTPANTSRRRAPYLTLLCAVFLAALPTGCKILELKVPGEPLSKSDLELRARTREFAATFASTLQATTDDIARSTTNAQTQTDLVLWKVGAIGSVRRAALRMSPTLALVDLWTYCRQMTEFFENGTGANLFGGAQAQPMALSRAMETGIVAVARATLPTAKFREMEKFVADYAKASPLKSLVSGREPVATQWEAVQGKPTAAPVGTSAEALADLADRVQMLGEQVPTEFRWHLDLRVAELENSLAEVRLVSRHLDQGLTRIADVAASTPAAMSNAVRELREGIVPSFAGLETQWAATLAALQHEREALAKDIAVEREAVLGAVAQHRVALMKDAERMVGDLTDRSLRQLRGTIRDVLLYVVLLAVVVLGLPFLFGFLAGRASARWRPPNTCTDSR